MLHRLSIAVSLVLVAGAIAFPALATGSAEAAAATVAAPTSEADLGAKARATGTRVELPMRTTETSQTFVNPAGSFTVEQSVTPVRVRRSGAWVPVNTTLSRRADGTVAPAAVVGEVAFSGGGATPMAKVGRGGVSLTLGWPANLPTPTLAGDTATYSEVLPGVDLLLTAQPDGISDVLVVKTAAAAAQPGVRQVQFSSRVTAGSLKPMTGGGFNLVDGLGTTVFTSAPAVMWDSTDVAAPGLSAAQAGSGDPTRGPGERSRVAPVGQQSSPSAMTLTPDTALLTSPGTQFPVYIDPNIKVATRQASTMIDSAHPTTSYYGSTDSSILGVGYNDTTGTIYRKRLFWRFDMVPFRGTTISAATFKAYEVFAYSCTPSTVYAWETSGFDSTTTWSNRPPAQVTQNDARTVAYGRTGCSPSGQWVEFNTRAAVAHAAASGWTSTTLGLYAYEGNNAGWKRFRQDAVLSVTYNLAPLAPSNLQTTSPTTTCVTGAGRPVIANDAPIFWARLNDETGDSDSGTFELTRLSDGAVTTMVVPLAPANIDRSIQAPPFAAPIAGTYSWRVKSMDAAGAPSPWSAPCEFAVDLNALLQPTVTATPDADPSTPDIEAQLGASITFTLGTGGATGVSYYRWSINDDVPAFGPVPVASPTVIQDMTHLGTNYFRVWSYDAAGNPSAPQALQVQVSTGAAPIPTNWWRLDEGAGTTTANATPGGSALALSGGTSWTSGRFQDVDITDRAVHLDGITGAAASSASSVVKTDQNFTVAAWVRLPSTATNQVAISADGSTSSPLMIGLVPAAGISPASYAVTMANPATGKSASYRWSQGPVFGEWAHLAVVYEAGSHNVTLYVDGQAVSGAPLGFTPALASGPLRLGRGQAAGSMWSGDVDDVRVFDGALGVTQVQAIRNTRG